MGNWSEAASAYERAVELDPSYSTAMFDLGGARWNLGEHNRALEIWVEAAKRFPKDEQVDRVLDFLKQQVDP